MIGDKADNQLFLPKQQGYEVDFPVSNDFRRAEDTSHGTLVVPCKYCISAIY